MLLTVSVLMAIDKDRGILVDIEVTDALITHGEVECEHTGVAGWQTLHEKQLSSTDLATACTFRRPTVILCTNRPLHYIVWERRQGVHTQSRKCWYR